MNICIITWSLWAFLSQQRELAPLRQKLFFFYLTPLCFTAASSYCHCVKKKTKINKTKTISYFNQNQKYLNPLVPDRTLKYKFSKTSFLYFFSHNTTIFYPIFKI